MIYIPHRVTQLAHPFRLYGVQLLLSSMGYLPKMYDKVDATYRLLLLEALQCMVTDSDISIPVTSIKFLVKQFKGHSDCILKTCEKYVERLEPEEVAELLRLLASASAKSKYRSELQKDMSLLITCSGKLQFALQYSQPLLCVFRDLEITRSLTYLLLSQSLKCLTLEKFDVLLAVNVKVCSSGLQHHVIC
jgi:hypothetical protein